MLFVGKLEEITGYGRHWRYDEVVMQSFQGDIANSFHYGLSIDRDVIGYYGIGDSHVNFAMLEVIGPNAEGLAADAANVRFFSRVKCGVDL